ncbi:MAG: tRNA (N6-threonylcarbamoyladenosine(37)-N6)-methyltransferase TrmO [Blastocatellia bacterium]|nr:tRNA (N6-threonylcarbamoyladenosine(37)-N6)-methyltransferase TrmO [Blastocatellia bacterium]
METAERTYTLAPIGVIHSDLKNRDGAPRQGYDGAPDAWVEVFSAMADGLLGVSSGDEIIVLTWLDRAHRNTLQVHPGRRPDAPLAGVFATRSPDRPNPIGLHRVTVLEITGQRLKVGPIEAIDGTPVIDIKPVLFTITSDAL